MDIKSRITAAVTAVTAAAHGGRKQEQIASAMLQAYNEASSLHTVRDLLDVPIGSLIVVYGTKGKYPVLFTKTTEESWMSHANNAENTNWFSCDEVYRFALNDTMKVVTFGE